MPQNSDVSKVEVSVDHITAGAGRRLGVGFASEDASPRVCSTFWSTHMVPGDAQVIVPVDSY